MRMKIHHEEGEPIAINQYPIRRMTRVQGHGENRGKDVL